MPFIDLVYLHIREGVGDLQALGFGGFPESRLEWYSIDGYMSVGFCSFLMVSSHLLPTGSMGCFIWFHLYLSADF